MKTLRLQSVDQWRDWLDEHHASESEVWLVFYKQQAALLPARPAEHVIRCRLMPATDEGTARGLSPVLVSHPGEPSELTVKLLLLSILFLSTFVGFGQTKQRRKTPL